MASRPVCGELLIFKQDQTIRHTPALDNVGREVIATAIVSMELTEEARPGSALPPYDDR
ncbi:MAG: hypothetical protein ACLQAT_07215 [Candidatus Binataceae bacterium]